MLATIGRCALNSWSMGIGDPTIWGWITVGIYVVAAVVAFTTMRAAPFPFETRRREQVFWGILAIGLAFLAINKQLDLQTLLTTVGRCAASLQGWYQDRRFVQGLLILGLLIFVIGIGVCLLIALRGTMRRSFIPLLGALFVCGFVLIRAVGMHQVDAMLGMRLPPIFGSLRMNFLLEAPGPLLIAGWGLWLSRRSSRARLEIEG